jgi:hypothetical protein
MFPKLKMKVKGLNFVDVAEVQGAVSDELKEVQKEEFSADFPKLYDCTKACVYANGAYFEFKKKGYASSACVFNFKKISPRTFGLHCVCVTRTYHRF